MSGRMMCLQYVQHRFAAADRQSYDLLRQTATFASQALFLLIPFISCPVSHMYQELYT